VPITVQRIEYEEKVEQFPVRTCRYVSETKAVQVPRTVGKWVAHQTTTLRPRIVTMRVDPFATVAPAPVATVAPVPAATAPSILSAPRTIAPTQTQRPTTSGSSSSGSTKSGSTSGGASSSAPGTPTEASRSDSSSPKPEDTPRTPGRIDAVPKDSDPTGRPSLSPPENARNTSYDRNA
jgi:hypothetical protein